MSDSRYTVPALQRGLEILCLFSRSRRAISAPEMAGELGLPRTTVFRMVQTLEQMGFLRREADGRRYALGPVVLGMGFDCLAALDVVELARPHLEALRDATGYSTHLAVREGAEIIYVARHPGRATLSGSVVVGTRLPAHATGMGRLLLCEVPEAELAGLFHDPLPAHTPQTPTTLAALKALLAADRARGHVLSHSFFERGVSAISAPVRDGTGQICAAINLTVLDPAVAPERLGGELLNQLLAAAAAISRALNWRPAQAAE
ncbi:MAG: IclR family transcriptional regulator [Thalassobaculales bacterium]